MRAGGTLALLIPAYNAAAHLPRLLSSAAAQADPFDEVWVYDDASTDDTSDVAKRWGARVVRGDVNRGCSVGKNALARQVSADWIHFHDADDELLPNFTTLARKWMEDGRHDVVLFPYQERSDPSGELIGHNWFDAEDAMRDPRSYAIRRQINPFCGLYRRDTFLTAGGYDEDPAVLYNEDVAMHIGLAFSGLRFAADTEISIINHRRAESMSSANGLKCVRAQYEVMRRTVLRPGAENYRKEIASRLWRITAGLAAYRDWRHARAAVRLAASLGRPLPEDGSRAFRLMANIMPEFSVYAREQLIRLLRPRLRREFGNSALDE